MSAPPPDACGIAFKEWAGVRDALASGRQTIVLRKGGILEGSAGFSPEHEWFWIYPTYVHESEQGLRSIAAPFVNPSPDVVSIDTLVHVVRFARIDAIEEVQALEDEHVWTADTIRKRFEYRAPGLWWMAVRVWTIPTPHRLAVRPEDAGCRTWVPLEGPLAASSARPVLSEEAFALRMRLSAASTATGRASSQEAG